MRLTRQHFQLVADAVDLASINTWYMVHSDEIAKDSSEDYALGFSDGAEDALRAIRRAFTAALAGTNELFDVSRFLDACCKSVTEAQKRHDLDVAAERINRERELDQSLTKVNESTCETCGDTADWCPERGWKTS